ncbi:MAG: glycosyltransferase family 4 protein [Bacteroidia bacterium]|nr:glycosyltransferase family 4 protein [Bacteroidia bacterium]
MPKILRIINRFNLGGPTYNVAYLTKYLAPEFETLLIGGDKEEGEDSSTFILDDLGIKPLIIPEIKREIDLKNDRAAYKKIKEIISEFKPDIVHTHASKAGALGRLAAAKMKVPVIVHTFHGHVFHSYFGKAKTGFYKSVERYLAKKSSAIIAISPLQKNELVNIHKIAPEEKVKVISLGFDLSRFFTQREENRKKFRSEYLIDEDEIVISIIGRLAPVKNHGLFLKAFADIQTRSSKKVRAFIVGDGETRVQTEQLAKQLNIDFVDFPNEKRKAPLVFTSWIKEIEFPLAGSDIVCLTSDNEGTPVSLIEAQAAGKPVVSTNVGGIRDLLHPEIGLLSEKGDVKKFAENLLFLVENPEKLSQFSKQATEFVRERFHYQRLTREMAELYRVLLLKGHE